MEPEKSHDLLAGGQRIFNVWHGCTRWWASDFGQLPVQCAENLDQLVVRAAIPVVEFFAALIEGAHPSPIRTGITNHGVPAEDRAGIVRKFQFQHDLDDGTTTLVGKHGLRGWHRLAPFCVGRYLSFRIDSKLPN